MPLYYNPKSVCTDNAAMIAWMGWEIKNAGMDFDLRNGNNTLTYHKLPLGSHTIDLINIKSKTLRTMKQLNEKIAKTGNKKQNL